MQSNLSVFFLHCTFCVLSKKSSHPKSQCFLLKVFFSYVLHLDLWPFCVFCKVCCVGWGSVFAWRPVFQHHVFSNFLNCLRSFGKDPWAAFGGCIPGPFVLLIRGPVPLSTQHCLVYWAFVVSLEIGYCASSSFAFLFQNCFNYCSSFLFLLNFRISLCIFTKIPAGVLFGIALNLLTNLGRFNIFTILCLSTHKHNTSLRSFRFSLLSSMSVVWFSACSCCTFFLDVYLRSIQCQVPKVQFLKSWKDWFRVLGLLLPAVSASGRSYAVIHRSTTRWHPWESLALRVAFPALTSILNIAW